MGMFQKQFDDIVVKAILHYAKDFKRDYKDLKFLLRLKRKPDVPESAEPKKKYDLCIKLLVDLVPHKMGASDWELRFLEDVLLKNFPNYREPLFKKHIRRLMIELAGKGDISFDEIKFIISVVEKKLLSGMIIHKTVVQMYNGGRYVKLISEEDILSDEQISETAQNIQDGSDND
jgi:hypothetical protein